MKNEIFNRFDIVMSNLKAVEPSPSFEFEFRERFKEAVAEKYREAVPLPRVPVFATAALALVLLMAIGLYIYSIQPASPVLISREGIVMVRGQRDVDWKAVDEREYFKVGDIITTKDGSQLDIVLPNRYTIRLKHRTEIKIACLTPRHGKGMVSFELSQGMMLASIDEGFEGSQFVVETEAATAKALGTKFAIEVNQAKKSKTEVSVLEGKVEVKSRYRPERIRLAKQTVIVGAGQKTAVSIGGVPLTPQRLLEKEWRQLEELYQIGKKPQIILLIKNTPDRVNQLLRPCPIYISDEKPREIPKILEDAVLKIEQAIKTEDKAKHLEGIKLLERIVEEHPNPKYDVQLLLYIGAYYEYLSYHREAIRTFEKALKRYPASPLASLAQCAIGVIYEKKLHDSDKANKAYRSVLNRYPNSLEAIWIEEKLVMKKLENKTK